MAGRDAWLDGADVTGSRIRKSIKITPSVAASKQFAGKTIRIRRPVRDGDVTQTYEVGGHTIKVSSGPNGFKLTREPVPETPYESPFKKTWTPADYKAERERMTLEVKAKMKAALIESGKKVFWMNWPLLCYAFAVILVLTMHPIAVVAGLMIALLGWKGKKIADWCDAKETAAKERRRLEKETKQEMEIQRRVKAAQKPIDWAVEQNKVLGTDTNGTDPA